MIAQKTTLQTISEFSKAYAAASKSGSTTFSLTKNELCGAVDKIGEMITLKGSFDDDLTFMDGAELPLGRTVEEYFRALAKASLYEGADKEGPKVNVPEFIPYEKCAYSTKLDRVKFKSSTQGDALADACINEAAFANLVAGEQEEISDQKSIYKFNIKKAALGNVIAKCRAATNAAQLVETVKDPAQMTAEEAETFITNLKTLAKKLRFANEGNNLGNCLIGGSKNVKLRLVVKVGVLDQLDKLAKAGAFHDQYFDLTTVYDIDEVDDFGSDTKAIALVLDPRSVKVKPWLDRTYSYVNGDGDFMSTVNHYGVTIFTSLYTPFHVYTLA